MNLGEVFYHVLGENSITFVLSIIMSKKIINTFKIKYLYLK